MQLGKIFDTKRRFPVIKKKKFFSLSCLVSCYFVHFFFLISFTVKFTVKINQKTTEFNDGKIAAVGIWLSAKRRAKL